MPLALVLLCSSVATASADSFTDPGSRVFTLHPRLANGDLDNAGRLRTLPNGDIVFQSGINQRNGIAERAWRLRANGRLEPLAAGRHTGGWAVASDGAIVALRHKGRTVDRLDSERARWTPLADLPRRAWGVAALANGTVIAAGDTEGWLLRPGRRMKEIALPPPSRRSLRGLPEVPPHSRRTAC